MVVSVLLQLINYKLTRHVVLAEQKLKRFPVGLSDGQVPWNRTEIVASDGLTLVVIHHREHSVTLDILSEKHY